MRVSCFAFAAVLLLLTTQASALGSIRLTSENSGLCDASVNQQSGYYDLKTGDAHYFYWMFESRNDPTTDPFIVWMTGGPGCSGMLALTNENGPCTIAADGTDTIKNEYSWTNNATVLWIDQPTGTGFSYGDQKVSNEEGVSENMYDFLVQFMTANPQYQKLPLHIVGESYGGHYVPSVAQYINANDPGKKVLNLAGAAVGNGLTDPTIQYKYYPEMAISTNDHPAAVDEQTYNRMEASVGPCIKLIKACNTGDDNSCIKAYDFCNTALMAPYEATGLNPYDMRKQCGDNPLCYNFTATDVFFNDPSVQQALGVDKTWESCNNAVNAQFQGDWMKDVSDNLSSLLASQIHVTIYAGDQDYVCNWLGNYYYINELQWQWTRSWQNTARQNWTVGGDVVGYYQSYQGLTFVRVYKAGHMVPMDQPAAASDLIQRTTSGTW